MKIATSILNSSDRIESVINLSRTNTSYIHIDVMDGKFVSDEQFSIKEIRAVNLVTKYPLDVHLMVNDPIKYIEELNDLNISYITFHLEVKKDKKKIISKIKEMGYKVGISIKPDTDIEELVPYLKDIDMVLVMSVEPGRGGQKFLNGTVKRVKALKKMIVDGGYSIEIEVDGGINDTTITKLDDVDIAVVGSYIVKSDNYYRQIEKLLDVVDKKNTSQKFIRNNLVSNWLILGGLFLILISFCLELGTDTYNLLSSVYDHPFIFLIGFVLLSIGLFRKSILKIDVDDSFKVRKDKVQENRKRLYSVLLVVGMLPFLSIIGFWVFLMFTGEMKLSFNLLMIGAVCFQYWPFMLLGFLLVVVSIVRLSEIKRLS